MSNRRSKIRKINTSCEIYDKIIKRESQKHLFRVYKKPNRGKFRISMWPDDDSTDFGRNPYFSVFSRKNF